jgi:hypothetical protein
MNIQSIQKMMGPTVLAILTALCKDLYVGLARFGCGIGGIWYED